MPKNRLLNAHRAVNLLLRKVALGMDRNQLNQEVIALSEHLFGRRQASILMLRADTQTLHLEYAPSLPRFYCEAVEGVGIGPNVGSCGAAAFFKQTVVVDDINHHENWAPFTSLTQQANLHACWSVPIIASTGDVLGTFAIYSNSPSTPHEYEVEALEILASLYAVAIEKYRLEEQLYFHASRDPLTHCFNRRVLLSEVEKKMSYQSSSQDVISCFFVDVDKFKYINDQFGHDVGDQILIHIAEYLKQVLPSNSIIGRYGGDEFVCFSLFTDTILANEFADNLRSVLKNIDQIEAFAVTASLGVSIQSRDATLAVKDLIKQADIDMYDNKKKMALTVCG